MEEKLKQAIKTAFDNVAILGQQLVGQSNPNYDVIKDRISDDLKQAIVTYTHAYVEQQINALVDANAIISMQRP